METKNLILLPIYNREAIIEQVLDSISSAMPENTDILVVDDGSNDESSNLVKTGEHIKYLKHESSLGYGAALIHGIEFAVDFNYANIITLDIAQKNIEDLISPLLNYLTKDNLDLINYSRIKISNEEKDKKDYSVYSFATMITSKLNNLTGHNLCDVFSPIKAFKTKITEKMSLEEYDEALILQLFIQAAYFGYKVKEVNIEKAVSIENIDETCLEKDQQYYLDFLESEKYLYPLHETN
jgi:glycosyltransferase involved in cell wall biosynthesis